MDKKDGIREVNLRHIIYDILKPHTDNPLNCIISEVMRYDNKYTSEEVVLALDDMYKHDDVVPVVKSGIKCYILR